MGESHHVRFRDPDDFSEIRTPEWAANDAGAVVSGARVRTGTRAGSDEWVVQSVLLPESVGEADAGGLAEAIVAKNED